MTTYVTLDRVNDLGKLGMCSMWKGKVRLRWRWIATVYLFFFVTKGDEPRYCVSNDKVLEYGVVTDNVVSSILGQQVHQSTHNVLVIEVR